MISEKVEIVAANGLHARPATELVKISKVLDGQVTIATEAKTVKSSSMLGILSLGLKKGTVVTVTAEGGDEQTNLRAVADFLANFTE